MLSKEKTNSKEKQYNLNVIFGIFLILVFVGKVVRYTIMKKVLVDTSAGHYFIDPILYGDSKFKLLESDSLRENLGGNAIVIYRLINIFKLDTYIGWEIYISLIWNIILIAILAGLKKKLDWKQFIFIGLSIIVLNLFDFTLAKEPVQMLYFIAIYFVLTLNTKKSKLKYYATIAILLFSAVSYRAYYFLIVMFMIYVQVVINIFVIKKEKLKLKDVVFILVLTAGFYCLFLNYMKVMMKSEYNELIRVRTRESNAASDMRNIFRSTNLIVFSIDYLVMVLRMLFPVELLRLGIKYIPYVLYQIVITYFVIKSLKNVRHNGYVKNIALYMYIGFLFASATFEPDFGSWVRHETVAFPVMLILADLKKKGDLEENE